MTTKDLNNLIRWCCDTDGEQFAKDIYNGDEMNEYKTAKFIRMQNNTITWIASLDNENRERLVKAINKKGDIITDMPSPELNKFVKGKDNYKWHCIRELAKLKEEESFLIENRTRDTVKNSWIWRVLVYKSQEKGIRLPRSEFPRLAKTYHIEEVDHFTQRVWRIS